MSSRTAKGDSTVTTGLFTVEDQVKYEWWRAEHLHLRQYNDYSCKDEVFEDLYFESNNGFTTLDYFPHWHFEKVAELLEAKDGYEEMLEYFS